MEFSLNVLPGYEIVRQRMQRFAPGVVVRRSILQGGNPERDGVRVQQCGLSAPRATVDRMRCNICTAV